jgi:hypothetical protein
LLCRVVDIILLFHFFFIPSCFRFHVLHKVPSPVSEGRTRLKIFPRESQ